MSPYGMHKEYSCGVGIVATGLKKYKCHEVESALIHFATGLDELYDRMLLQIPSNRRETTAKILRWVAMAFRPLTMMELSTANSIGTTADSSSRLSCERVMRERVEGCGHLLCITNTVDEVDPSDGGDFPDEDDPLGLYCTTRPGCRRLYRGVVSLVHQSVKDYLLRKTSDPIPELEIFHIDEETTHSESALKCLA